jgi:hypothetical protein
MNVLQTSPLQTRPPHKPNLMRGALLVFLLVVGPVITLFGYITNNLGVSLILDLIVYVIGIVFDAAFEEIRVR